MTLETAKKLNLDVYMFAITATKLAAQTANTHIAQGREVFTFVDYIGITALNCVACGPRPGAGKIARAMKEHKKTVREVIQEE